MNKARKPYFIANWKMNLTRREAGVFCKTFETLHPVPRSVEVGIAPALTTVPEIASWCISHGIMLGAQNVHWLNSGAHTGEISVSMLQDWGVSFAIIGHSERRQFYGETNEAVAKRARAAIDANLVAVVCVGELEADFRASRTEQVVGSQLTESLSSLSTEHLARLVLAYEPVWAIGTGLAATPEIAQRVHHFIRGNLTAKFGPAADTVSILYGGSTTPANIHELCLQPDVDGALVGGASLKPESFSELIASGSAAHLHAVSG